MWYIEVRHSSSQVHHSPVAQGLQEKGQLPQVVQILEQGGEGDGEKGLLLFAFLIGVEGIEELVLEGRRS